MSAAVELANYLNLHPRVRDGGISFCRRASRTNKATARNEVLRGFGRRAWPGNLSFLTMPSLDWQFERGLLNNREHGKGRYWRSRVTQITSVENSPFVYRVALAQMPGAEDGLSCNFPVPSFAKLAVRTGVIGRYYQAELADLAVWKLTTPHFYDAAWVDLTGPLSFAHLDTLLNLWQRTRSVLIVTSLRARWATEFTNALEDAGGIAELLMADLAHSVVVDEFAYTDTSPMHQIKFWKLVRPQDNQERARADVAAPSAEKCDTWARRQHGVAP